MNSSYIENELFVRISEGDGAAFAYCYRQYGNMLRPFLIKLIGSRDIAEEIIQEVFLKVWLHRDRLAEVENPKSWLFRKVFRILLQRSSTSGELPSLYKPPFDLFRHSES